MRTLKTYEAYNHFGELIVSGTASKCAECLGMNDHHFRNVANLAEAGGYKKYRIVNTTPKVETAPYSGSKELAKMWDDFMDPIRKRYGIPVYQPSMGGGL